MSTRKFCRAKALRQEPSSAPDGLAIVKDLLENGTVSLADDVRANLHKLDIQLQVLAEFPEELSGAAAARRKPAATTPGATPIPVAAGGKKEHKRETKGKDSKEVTEVKEAEKHKEDKGSAKEHKKEKDDKESKEGTAVEESKKRKQSEKGAKEHKKEKRKRAEEGEKDERKEKKKHQTPKS